MRSDIDELSDVPPISDLYVLSEDAVHNEALRVLDELTEFLSDLLPQIAAVEPDRFLAEPSETGPPTLREWRASAARLRGTLNTIDSSSGPPQLDRDEFAALLGPWPEPGLDFMMEEGRIRWLLSWGPGLRWSDVAQHLEQLSQECQPVGPNDFDRSMEATKQWMLGCSVQNTRLHRAFCDVLPAIADRNPAFATLIFDVEEWRQRILAKPLVNNDRDRELNRLDGQFRHALHYAVQHVVVALANNHFMQIRAHVNHPEFTGPSSWQLPYRLFTILLNKAEICMDVRRHVRERAKSEIVQPASSKPVGQSATSIEPPRPKLSKAEWWAAVDRTAREITEFAAHLLPAIADRDPPIFTAHLEPDPPKWTESLRGIDEWKSAAKRLRDVLLGEVPPMQWDDEAAEFKRFSGDKPSIDYSVVDGRIRWRISSYITYLDWPSAAQMMFQGRLGWPPRRKPPGHSVEATKSWLLAGSPEDSAYYDVYIAMLPVFVDDDPEFVRTMLDPDAWRQRIESNAELSPKQRERQLSRLLDPIPKGYFRLVTHNALLHVIGALANNRFDEIRPYIDHPEFVGRYTPLVPHYLFANLWAKVDTLQKLAPTK